MPVSVVLADPALSAPQLVRRPVVVMPDTGIGRHPWFDSLPSSAPATPEEVTGVSDVLTGGLDRLAGHGTFIAGIVRQTCPAARLVPYTVMTSAGVLLESDLLRLLQDILDRQLAALSAGDAGAIIDVVTLSIGYYHEQPTDQITDIAIARLMRELGRAGVLVVAAAGNDATNRPLLPAGFAGQVVGLERDALPLVSVGSLNPGQASVSLFSNAGEWVTTYRPGASIVSTLPVTQDASAQPSRHAAAAPGDARTRATIDPDDYSGGFGVWSGTSFAAPVLAGELAQHLVQQGPEDVHLDALIERGWKALSSVLPALQRPPT